MKLTSRPVRIANGGDEDGLLVFDEDERLVAVLALLSDHHGELAGHWFIETGFGPLYRPNHPTFPDVSAALDWIGREIVDRPVIP